MMKYTSKLAYLLGLSVLVGVSIVLPINITKGDIVIQAPSPYLINGVLNRTKLDQLYLGNGLASDVSVKVRDGVLQVLNGVVMGEDSSVESSRLVTIGGGKNNSVGAGGDYSGIGGGHGNSINSSSSVIGGGSGNIIKNDSLNSAIAGGINNVVDNGGTVVGGNHNTAKNGGSIIGGQNNISDGEDSLILGSGSKGGRGSFAWNSPNTLDYSAVIMASGGVLIGTYNPVSGVNLVVNGAMQIGENANSGTVGEIKMQSGCFYAYDGISRHVVNKNPSEGCPDIKCAFGSILLKQGDSAIGYRQSYAANCSGDGNWLSLTCNADGSMGDGGEYYPYCYNLDDEGNGGNLDTSCKFRGQIVLDGESVTGYYASSVPAGGVCKSQVRTCNNGRLSGDYEYSDCKVACEFNNQSIPHGGSVVAYQSPSVLGGGSCKSQVRTCNNGILSGTYTNPTCHQGCYWPTGDGTGVRYPHGTQKTGYTSLGFLTNGNGSNTCPDVPVLVTGTCQDGEFSNGITPELSWKSSENATLYHLESCPNHCNCTYATVSIWDEINRICHTRTGYNIVSAESGYRVNGDLCPSTTDTRCRFSGERYMPGDIVYGYTDLDGGCREGVGGSSGEGCRKKPVVCQLNGTWSQNIYTSCTLHGDNLGDYIFESCPTDAICNKKFVSIVNKDNRCDYQRRYKFQYCSGSLVRCSTGENCTCRLGRECYLNGKSYGHNETWEGFTSAGSNNVSLRFCQDSRCTLRCYDGVFTGSSNCNYKTCYYYYGSVCIGLNCD